MISEEKVKELQGYILGYFCIVLGEPENVDLDNPFDTRAVVQSLDNRFVEQLSLFLRDRV